MREIHAPNPVVLLGMSVSRLTIRPFHAHPPEPRPAPPNCRRLPNCGFDLVRVLRGCFNVFTCITADPGLPWAVVGIGQSGLYKAGAQN